LAAAGPVTEPDSPFGNSRGRRAVQPAGEGMPHMLKSSQPARRSPVRTAKFVSLVVLVALGLTARAADEPPGGEEGVRDNTEQVLQQAAALAGAGGLGGPGSTVVVGMLLRGDQLHLWKLEESDTAPQLRPALLKYVKDSTEIRIDDAAREAEAYCE